IALANATESVVLTSVRVAPMIIAPTPCPSERSGTICADATPAPSRMVPPTAAGIEPDGTATLPVSSTICSRTSRCPMNVSSLARSATAQPQPPASIAREECALRDARRVERRRQHVAQRLVHVLLARQGVGDAAQQRELGGLDAALLRQPRHRGQLPFELADDEPRVLQL